MTLPELADALAEGVSRTGGAAPAVLFLATLVEYVFPPFPGDLLVVLGAWWVVEGAVSWPVAFAAVTAGATIGAFVDYRIGAAVGRRLEGRAERRGPLSRERLERFEAAYRRWGSALLLANRLLPGVRAFIFLAAGASGIPLRRVLVLGALSAALWNGVLLGVGVLVVHNVEELVALFEQYTRVAWAAVGAAGALAAVALLLRVRAWGRRPGGSPS